MISTDLLILKNLLHNEEYARRVLVILEPEFFNTDSDRRISKFIKAFNSKYSKLPPYSAAKIYFTEKDKKITERELKETLGRIEEIEQSPFDSFEMSYLIEQTDAHFKERSVYNSILKAVDIYENKKAEVSNIPDLITKALQVTIDTEIGHDYLIDSEKQLDYYHSDTERFMTHLKSMNTIIGNGFKRKTLNVFLGQPKAGKSRLLLDLGLHFVRQGLNVLYITLELAENVIRQRADANLMDIDINKFEGIDKDIYRAKMTKLKKELRGHLIIKEYPTGGATIHNIESLYKEVAAKKNFKPTIVIVDYLTIMRPAANLGHEGGNLYMRGKTIAEELRAFAVKNDIVLLTAGQLNRSGWNISDVEMGHVAESAGIAATCDFMASISATKELIQDHKIFLTVLCNRLYSLANSDKFMLGFDDSRMRHFDVAYENVPEAKEDHPQHQHRKIGKAINSKFDDWDFGDKK